MPRKKRKKGVRIDFSKVKGKYQGKEWNALKQKQEENKKNIIYWNSASGGKPYEVKRRFLYYGGKKVYKWKGWGLGKGRTYYETKEKGYFKPFTMTDTFYNYLKKYMKPFKIPISRKR